MKRNEVWIGKAIAPTIEALGLELWGVEYSRHGRRATLRVFIDCLSGVTVDDCARVSRQVSAILDVEDPIQSGYTLEVSSPGLERPLFTLPQYERFLGAEVKLRLREPRNGRRKFAGVIEKVVADAVELLIGDETLTLSHADIERAVLAPAATDAAMDAALSRGGERRDPQREDRRHPRADSGKNSADKKAGG